MSGTAFYGNRYRKNNDNATMVLFDKNGFIAGVQAGVSAAYYLHVAAYLACSMYTHAYMQRAGCFMLLYHRCVTVLYCILMCGWCNIRVAITPHKGGSGQCCWVIALLSCVTDTKDTNRALPRSPTCQIRRFHRGAAPVGYHCLL